MDLLDIKLSRKKFINTSFCVFSAMIASCTNNNRDETVQNVATPQNDLDFTQYPVLKMTADMISSKDIKAVGSPVAVLGKTGVLNAQPISPEILSKLNQMGALLTKELLEKENLILALSVKHGVLENVNQFNDAPVILVLKKSSQSLAGKTTYAIDGVLCTLELGNRDVLVRSSDQLNMEYLDTNSSEGLVKTVNLKILYGKYIDINLSTNNSLDSKTIADLSTKLHRLADTAPANTLIVYSQEWPVGQVLQGYSGSPIRKDNQIVGVFGQSLESDEAKYLNKHLPNFRVCIIRLG